MHQADCDDNPERRKALRIPLCLAAAAGCDAWMTVCYTKDIGEGGVFLISQRIPSIRTGFSVELQLPGRIGFLRQSATVVRTQIDSPSGFGLAWSQLTEESAKLLKELKQRWEKAFPRTDRPSSC